MSDAASAIAGASAPKICTPIGRPAPLGATAQTFRAYELADDDIRAEAPAQPPERRLADTGLRRQVERRVIVRKKIGKIHRHL
jgi:hypothetical protein